MVYRPSRWEYRITLSDVDRGVNLDTTAVLGQHPSETTEHLVLRALAFCLVAEPDSRIEFGPGVCVGDAPDVLAHDLTGKLSLWVGCGDVAPDLARKIVQHNRDARVHVVFARADRRDAFVQKVASWDRRPRGWQNLTVWLLPAAVVERLAGLESLRQRWVVTLVGDHLYLEVDGLNLEGAIERLLGPGEAVNDGPR